MTRLAGGHEETTVSQITSEATIKKRGKKNKMREMYVLTPTFVRARHPLQVFCKGRLSANQVREYADLWREDRYVILISLSAAQGQHVAHEIRAEISLFFLVFFAPVVYLD